ncbi:THAP domain-containing protein 6-like [Brachionichthys hirsutus]|uniref:THAP domain-containing protein 6-like n=1 Tax=Brachionichthys hirsutus TaxID=412623 RepID=UPI0036053BE5
MPQFCAAFGCSNERTIETREQGITFHKFPADSDTRRTWELSLRREGFQATKHSVLCSAHFRTEDFDRTGQTIRLRGRATPSVFNFPPHLLKVEKPGGAADSRQAAADVDPVEEVAHDQSAQPTCRQPTEHFYALPSSTDGLKRKLVEFQCRVEDLERRLRNATDRERRVKESLKSVFEDLKQRNLLNEELEQRLQRYSD